MFSMFRNARVLVTGDLGFVGRNFVTALASQGAEVHGLDIKPGPGVVDGMSHRQMDCRDYFRACATRRYDLVVHLAAMVGGRATIEGDPLLVATDLSIDAEFFRWCQIAKPKHVVYFSSSAAYPIEYQQDKDSPLLLREDDIRFDVIKVPDLTYGWAKLTGEMLADQLRRTSDVKVHVFRPFSGYGEDQDLDYPFPSLARRAVEQADPFPIWSDTVRDFIHISDIVQAVLTAVEAGIEETVNLCTGVGTSFSALAGKMMDQQSGHRAVIDVLRDKPAGVMRRVGDPTLMNQFYKPVVSLDQGIALMLHRQREALIAAAI